MPLKTGHIALVLFLAGLPAPAPAQPFTENGMASGSGLSYLPTPVTTPMAHWRANYGRVEYLGDGLRGMNVFGLSYGLSTNVEGYLRLTGEQLGTLRSLTAYGFGVKGALPVSLPVVDAAALWFESTTTDEAQVSPFFPANSSRGGLLFSIGGPSLRGVALGGLNAVSGTTLVLAGGGVAWAPGSGTQAGAEILWGYTQQSSLHVSIDLSARVAPHVALLASPGYIRTHSTRTWTLSIGLSVGTADLDFRPTVLTAKESEFKLPSLEDIMKEPSEEKKQ